MKVFKSWKSFSNKKENLLHVRDPFAKCSNHSKHFEGHLRCFIDVQHLQKQIKASIKPAMYVMRPYGYMYNTIDS